MAPPTPPTCRPKYGCRAAIHHDAGIGKDEAGVGGLAYAEKLGMAMAAVATASARIGDGADMLARGHHQPRQRTGGQMRRRAPAWAARKRRSC